MIEKAYTTGEVAKFTGVNFRTVIRWIERGELEGYKLPGRGDHRVTLTHLLAFIERHGMPVPEELKPQVKRALVVDDDQPMAMAIARLLRTHGWEVELAFDGFEAGMKLVESGPSLMVLDLRMPYMDGFHVLKLTRNKLEYANLKILVVSAQGTDDLAKALALGANGVLEKPFKNQQLIEHVEQWFSA